MVSRIQSRCEPSFCPVGYLGGDHTWRYWGLDRQGGCENILEGLVGVDDHDTTIKNVLTLARKGFIRFAKVGGIADGKFQRLLNHKRSGSIHWCNSGNLKKLGSSRKIDSYQTSSEWI